MSNENLENQIQKALDRLQEARKDKQKLLRQQDADQYIPRLSYLRTAPYPVKHGVRFVEKTHRRLKHAHHRMWAIGLWEEERLRGVALVGGPKARLLGVDQGSAEFPPPYDRLEVVRVAVEEGVPNGCSMLYGACSRAGRAMGAVDMLTYTDEDEPGVSLRAAGWIPDAGLVGGGQASRQSRPRRWRTEQEACRRRRWWAPWSASCPRRTS